MLKKIASTILSALTLVSTLTASQSDHITYSWLVNLASQSHYTDHIPHWRRLFNTMHVQGFLECGCGFSTKYFLENADMVISVEYVTPGYGDKWYQECLTLFSDQANWIPLLYNSDYRSNSFNNACAYQCAMHKDYALIDSTYLKELDKHFKNLIKDAKQGGYDIDVGFVDPGVYVRGDLVKLLLANKVPIVVAHDTASDRGTKEVENLYGWNKVITPADYVKIYIPFGKGTTFWISKSKPEVIASLIAYRDSIAQVIAEKGKITAEELTMLADTP